MAAELRALVVFGEHRYFGESLPAGDKSWGAGMVGKLSVEQALADFAFMVEEVKTAFNASHCKVVALGGSYGGMLSAWFRLKYPAVVDAALAASAPVRMVTSDTKSTDFFAAVTRDFASADPSTPDAVRASFAEMEEVGGQEGGLEQLQRQFSLCETPKNLTTVVLAVVNAFTTLSMMDYPYPTDFLCPLPAWPVNNASAKILANPGIGGLVEVFEFVYGKPKTCVPLQDVFIPCADQTGCGVGPSGWSWDYLMCTEMSYTPNTNNVTDMFPVHQWDLSGLTKYCESRWNVKPQIEWSKLYFDDSRFDGASNIIFSNGLKDPWHVGGILKSLSPSLPALIVKSGAHHLDLRGSHKDDPADVIRVRREELRLLRKWISE